MSTPLFGAAGIDAPLLIYFFSTPLPPVSIRLFLHLNVLTPFLICVFFLGIDFMVFIKLRVLVGRKKNPYAAVMSFV